MKKTPKKKTTSRKRAAKKAFDRASGKVLSKLAQVSVAPVIDPARAEAAAEVLEAVWLREKNFDLESEIVTKDGRPIVDQDAEGHLWVTVKLHVPALDIDCWLDGTHLDHPDNQDDEEGS